MGGLVTSDTHRVVAPNLDPAGILNVKRSLILHHAALGRAQEASRADVRGRCIRHWVSWPGLLPVVVGMWVLLVVLWQRGGAGRHWQVGWSRYRRVHGLIETSNRPTPSLLLAGGLHRLSFGPGMDRGPTRGSVLFWLP